MLATASVGLFIENRGEFSNGRHALATSPDAVREDALVGYGFEMIGIGAAIQNMWLAAESAGLAGVFMGDVLIAEDAIKAALGIRGDLAGVLSIGHAPKLSPPRRLAEDRVVIHE